MSKNTIGPWIQSSLCPSYIVGGPDFEIVASMAEFDETGQKIVEFKNARENIKILASALRMREALQSIIRRWNESERASPLAWAMVEDARAALKEIMPACSYPDCGCAEARVCMGHGGPNNAAMELINAKRGHRVTP